MADGLARGVLARLKDQALQMQKMKSGNHDLFLNKMKENDPTFNDQIESTGKKTVHLLNKMFEDIDKKYKIAPAVSSVMNL